jgi:hypothetical protein
MRASAARAFAFHIALWKAVTFAPATLVTTTLSWVGSATFRDFVNGTLLLAAN